MERSGGAATLAFRIDGMDCAEEVAILRREIGPLVGGEERLAFDLLNGTMYAPPDADASAVIARVARTGMSASLVGGAEAPVTHPSAWRGRLTVASAVATLLGFLLHARLGG